MHRLFLLLRSPWGLIWLTPAPVLFYILNATPRIETIKPFGTPLRVAHYGWPLETYNVTPPPVPAFDFLNCIPGPPDAWRAFGVNLTLLVVFTLLVLFIIISVNRRMKPDTFCTEE